MDAQNVMEEWEVSPFDGGFEGLRDLASRRFSGAVEAGGAWLFLRDGDPLAVVEDLEVDPRPGDVDAFEGASGQAHEATHPATATLAAMLALDGDVRGQYFTEDTSLSTVHETLSGGGFTGYVELSENVLSGDYYVVYEDGEEDYLGVLGSSQRLLTGDEAQSKAEGEVGIYSVVAVSLPEVEIPRAESTAAGAADGAAGAGATSTDADAADAADTGAVDGPPEDESGPSLELEADDAEDPGTPAETPAEPDPGTEPSSGAEPETGSEAEAESETGSEAETGTEPPESPDETGHGTPVGEETDAGTEPAPESEPGPEPEPASAPEPGPDAEPDPQPASEPEPPAGSESEPSDPLGATAADAGAAADRSGNGSGDSVLEGVTTRSVPSLDPERTGRAESSTGASDAGAGGAASAAAREPARRTEPDTEPAPSQEPEPAAEPDRDRSEEEADRIEAVREEYEARIEELESELRSLREERDRLRERVSQLEAEGATAGGAGGAATGGPALSPAEALAGTSLFVREGTRGEATLEDAHAGRTDRETLAENLRIEYHTQFDDGEATVEGQPFETWLRSSAPYDFVEWLITDLLFEIQSTGASSALRPLYDAIPRIDRIGFEDPVTVGDGEETREITFDVVARNQMGEPLVAATIDEGRDPTRAESLQPLIGDAEDVALEHETLAATFSVTSSYFEPDALDAAREATSGSLLGREKYRSYVKLARKQGFHLCLVESREESFHLAVPEL